MTSKKVVYAIFIKATPEKVWSALTESKFTRQYFWGANVESDWIPDSPMRGFMDDGTTFMEGKILKAETGKILSHTFSMVSPDGTKAEESIVTFEIEPHGEVIRLIITHDDPTDSHEQALKGWEMSMSSLKSLLETGEALPFSS